MSRRPAWQPSGAHVPVRSSPVSDVEARDGPAPRNPSRKDGFSPCDPSLGRPFSAEIPPDPRSGLPACPRAAPYATSPSKRSSVGVAPPPPNLAVERGRNRPNFGQNRPQISRTPGQTRWPNSATNPSKSAKSVEVIPETWPGSGHSRQNLVKFAPRLPKPRLGNGSTVGATSERGSPEMPVRGVWRGMCRQPSG